MFGAYATARGLAISRLVIRFFWCGFSAVFVTYVYLWVHCIISLRCSHVIQWFLLLNISWHTNSGMYMHIHVQNCRKLLEERKNPNSDSFYFRIYIIVLGAYAALRLVLAMLLKFPMCHALSEMSDQSFFQFFKWIYQVFFFDLFNLDCDTNSVLMDDIFCILN